MPQPEKPVEPWHGKAIGIETIKEVDMPYAEPDPLAVDAPLCPDCWLHHNGECA